MGIGAKDTKTADFDAFMSKLAEKRKIDAELEQFKSARQE